MSASLVSNVVSFPMRQPTRNRMTARDRIEVLRWEREALAHGYVRVVQETGSDDEAPELGDFLLIYRRNSAWASWGVGCCKGGFTVWRPADGATTGWYATLRQALASVLGVEAEAPREGMLETV